MPLPASLKKNKHAVALYGQKQAAVKRATAAKKAAAKPSIVNTGLTVVGGAAAGAARRSMPEVMGIAAIAAGFMAGSTAIASFGAGSLAVAAAEYTEDFMDGQ